MRFIVSIILACVSLGAVAQNELLGLWEVSRVTVASSEMTPVNKWMRFKEGGVQESGNGWLMSSRGTYEYDAEDKTLLAYDPQGIDDPFGAFDVAVSENTMTWKRVEEDGMLVTVYLQRIDELPAAPANEIVGLWDLTEAKSGDEDLMPKLDYQGAQYLFIRWDRVFVTTNADGSRASGLWHIHGHRSQVTLLPYGTEAIQESWMATISNDILTMTGISESNEGYELTYERIRAFPE